MLTRPTSAHGAAAASAPVTPGASPPFSDLLPGSVPAAAALQAPATSLGPELEMEAGFTDASMPGMPGHTLDDVLSQIGMGAEPSPMPALPATSAPGPRPTDASIAIIDAFSGPAIAAAVAAAETPLQSAAAPSLAGPIDTAAIVPSAPGASGPSPIALPGDALVAAAATDAPASPSPAAAVPVPGVVPAQGAAMAGTASAAGTGAFAHHGPAPGTAGTQPTDVVPANPLAANVTSTASHPAAAAAAPLATTTSGYSAALALDADAALASADAQTSVPSQAAHVAPAATWAEARADAGARLPPVLPQVSMPADPGAGFDEVLGSRLSVMLEQGISHARIRISPEHLGAIDLQLSVDGDRVSAQFQSAHADVRAALEAGMARLREQLAEHGLQLAHAGVGGDASGSPGGNEHQAQTGTVADVALADSTDATAITAAARGVGLVSEYA